MESEATRALEHCLTGHTQEAQTVVNSIWAENGIDAIARKVCEEVEIICKLDEDIRAILPETPAAEALRHCAICFSTKVPDSERVLSHRWLKENASKYDKDRRVRAYITCAIGALSINGHLPRTSADIGNINSAIGDLLSLSGGVMEANHIEAQLLLVADRPDLVERLTSRAVRGNDITPILLGIWTATIRGQYQEAALSCTDIEDMLRQDIERGSWRVACMRGVALLHDGRYEEAAVDLEKAAKLTNNQQTSVLVNLIACYQHLRRSESEHITKLLRECTDPSNPVIERLDLLISAATNFDSRVASH